MEDVFLFMHAKDHHTLKRRAGLELLWSQFNGDNFVFLCGDKGVLTLLTNRWIFLGIISYDIWVLGFFKCLRSFRIKLLRFLANVGNRKPDSEGSSLSLELLAVVWFLLRALDEKQRISAWEIRDGKPFHEVIFLEFLVPIDDFTVACSVTWPLNGSEAGGDLALIQTSLVLSCKCT